MTTVAYFGCWDQAGHYLHTADGKCRGYESVGPWCARNLDDPDRWHGKGTPQRLGVETLHHEQGWTLLCMWDRSVDTRPGSHAIFLAEGTHDARQMWAFAREYFPTVFERLRTAYGEAQHLEVRP